MEITKITSVSLDILTPHGVYEPNVRAKALKQARETFTNICWGGMLITEVVRVLNTPVREIAFDRNEGTARMSVQIEVVGITMEQGEVLNGCTIAEIESNAVLTTHKHATMKIGRSSIAAVSNKLSIGDVIPVTITAARHKIGAPAISLLAIPFIIAKRADMIFEVYDAMDAHDMVKIDMLLDEIAHEASLHEELYKSSEDTAEYYLTIAGNLYPHDEQIDYATTQQARELGFEPVEFKREQLAAITPGLIVYPTEEDQSHAKMFWSAAELPDDVASVTTTACAAVSNVLTRYLFYLRCVRGFVETYHTAELRKGLRKYWRRARRSAEAEAEAEGGEVSREPEVAADEQR